MLLILTIASGTAFFVTEKRKPEPQTTQDITVTSVFSVDSSTYNQVVTQAAGPEDIVLPTDMPGVYYTATLQNEISFLQYNGSAFVPIPVETKKLDVTLTLSYESVPVTITYADINGTLVGYGLTTSDLDGGIKYYPYVFVKITKAPAGYGDGYLLLAAFDKENFYRQDKVWSEIYEFSADKKSYSTYVSQNTRLVNSQGVFRQDWIMMTDEFMANLGDAKYFMSSRYYTEDETGIRTDIMKYSNAYRPEIVKKDIYGTWFVNDGDGMHFLRKTEKGFESVTTDGKGKEKKVAEFDSDLFEDYLRSGNFVVCKKDRKVTDLLSGDTLCQIPLEISEMTMFSISPDRTKAVLACASENEQGTLVQTVVYVPLNGSSSPVRYSEPLLRSEGTDFVWIDGSTVMSARPSNDSGLQVCSVIYRFSA